jgi:hypothetical protein
MAGGDDKSGIERKEATGKHSGRKAAMISPTL